MLFVYFGSLARNLADIFTGAAGLDTNTTIAMGVSSAMAMIGIVWYTTHISRQAVNNALRDAHNDQLPIEISQELDELLAGNIGMGHDEEQGVGGRRTVSKHKDSSTIEMGVYNAAIEDASKTTTPATARGRLRQTPFVDSGNSTPRHASTSRH